MAEFGVGLGNRNFKLQLIIDLSWTGNPLRIIFSPQNMFKLLRLVQPVPQIPH